MDHLIRASLVGLLCLIQLAWAAAYAQSTSYVYDANGRVVAVTASKGSSVQYSYDALGHTSQISAPVSAGQLAIFNFTPTHGEVGTQVTLQGQGFDSNSANDTVSFNGAVATVLSASATQLVAAVPSGATTGPISVSVGSQTATSATPFVVDDTGAPTISQVSPLVVSAGNTVTVTGSHLDPIAGETTVRAGEGDMLSLATISDAQLQYVVPSNGVSGYITVTTPYGSATSATPVFVLPSAVNASNVVSSGYAVDGSGVNLTIGASGQYGAVTFAAPPSGWVSLQASGITTSASSISYTVYAPGDSVVLQGTISASSPSIHLPPLVAGAVYCLVIQPSGGGAQLTVNAQTNAPLTSAETTVTTTVPGQSTRLLIQGSTSQPLTVFVDSTATIPANQSVGYVIYNVAQQSILSGSISSSGTILVPVTTAGTYQIIINPGSGVTATTQLHLVSGNVLPADGQVGFQSALTAGQSDNINFTANAGDNLELTISNLSLAGIPYNAVTVKVLDPNGNSVASGPCYEAVYYPNEATCRLPLWNLLQGTYTAVITPGSTTVLTSFNATLQADTVGTTLSLNTPVTVPLVLGQVQRMTFTGNAGGNLALAIANVSTTSPTGQPITFAVYQPNGAILTTNPFLTDAFTSSGTFDLTNLPASGTYTVVMGTAGEPGTAQLTLIPQTIASNGQSNTYSGYEAGQNAGINFTANAGDNLELTISNLSIGWHPEYPVTVNVVDPNGTNVASGQCYVATYDAPKATCRFPLWNLIQGTYTAVISPPDSGSTLTSFSATLQADTIGAPLSLNTPVTVPLALGQVERMTFTGNAGDNLALAIANVSTTNATGQPITFAVYQPNGEILTTNAFLTDSFTSSGTFNLTNLPASGTYTVVMGTVGEPGTAQLTLIQQTIASNGQSTTYSGYEAGQNAGINFTANAGDNLELTLSNITLSGNEQYEPATVNVLDPNGTNVASGKCYYAPYSSTQSTCRLPLWNLVQGTYTVVIAPPNTGTTIVSFNATLQADTIGASLSLNAPVTVPLALGQVERMTFTGNAGDNLALTIANASTTSPSGQPITVAVYAPNTSIATTSAFVSGQYTSGGTLDLTNLPASGTYTVVVGTAGEPGAAQITLIQQTIASNGQSTTYSGYETGQNAGINFTANAGDNLELTLSNITLSGSEQYDPATVNVLDPNGTNVASGKCYYAAYSSTQSTCRFPLWNLVQGTYTVVIAPPNAGTTIISFNATLQADTTGASLNLNTPVTVPLALGQVERMTFTGNAGDNLALTIANASTTSPSGQPITVAVYAPNTLITTGSAYVSGQYTGSGTLDVTNLPVSGTYTVVMGTAGEPGTAQLTLIQQTIAPNDQSTTYSGYEAGQNAGINFTANAGDNLELTLSNITLSGSEQYDPATVNVLDPNGTVVASGNCYYTAYSSTQSTCRFSLWNLMQGTYTAVIAPPNAGTTIVSFNATLQADTIGSPLGLNTPITVPLALGQVERMTFTGNVGDNLALTIASVSTTNPSGQPITVAVYAPNTSIATTSAYVSGQYTSSGIIDLTNLPASGTYTVVVGTAGEPGAAQVTLIPQTIASNDQSTTYSGYATGQSAGVNFTANAGDNLELTLSNIALSESNVYLPATLNVLDPNGNNVASGQCYVAPYMSTQTTCRFPLWNLVQGTYTVEVSPPNSSSTLTSFNATLQVDTTGASLSLNTPLTVPLALGQVERMTFTGNAGDNLALTIASVSTTSPSGQPLTVAVYAPNSSITTGSAYVSGQYTSSGTLSMTSLPVGGTYTVIVSTSGEPGTAQLTLSAPSG